MHPAFLVALEEWTSSMTITTAEWSNKPFTGVKGFKKTKNKRKQIKVDLLSLSMESFCFCFFKYRLYIVVEKSLRVVTKILIVVSSEWREYGWLWSFYLCFLKNKHELVVILNKSRHLPTGRLHAVCLKALIITTETTPRNPPGFQGHKQKAQKSVLKKLKKKKKIGKCPRATWHLWPPIFNLTSEEAGSAHW